METIQVVLDKKLLRAADAAARRTRRNRSALVRDALRELFGVLKSVCKRRVTVAPITSTIRSVPSEVVRNQDDGMKSACAVNLVTRSPFLRIDWAVGLPS